MLLVIPLDLEQLQRKWCGEIIAIGVVTTSNTLLVDNVQGSFNIGVGTVLFNNGNHTLVD